MGDFPAVLELNVGGVHYTTTLKTLLTEPNTLLYEMFTGKPDAIIKDAKGRHFIDRDGVLFRYILDYLRDSAISLPEGFREKDRLKQEAEHFRLAGLTKTLNQLAEIKPQGCITVGYRGSFQFGKDGLADVKFRKLSRLLICGRVALCREIFGESLNESRDPDHGLSDRYTSRFFLKHTFIEQAFDDLQKSGFRLAGSCGSGTSGSSTDLKPGVDSEENRWNHYNEFVFIRD